MYNYLILIADDSDLSLASLEENLRTFYSQNEDRKIGVERIGDEITVVVNKFPFFIRLHGGPSIAEEALEIAEAWTGKPEEKGKIARCSRRLELHAEGQDFNMDYFNDSIYILGEIEEFSGVYIFDPLQGTFT